MKRIAIIHFHPLEYYPPITNLLNYLSEKKDVQISVYTTKPDKSCTWEYKIQESNVIIKRNGTSNNSKSKFERMFHYMRFYFSVTLSILLSKPSNVIYYETISSLPAIIWKWLNSHKIKLIIHYHEYVSPEEYRTGMITTRFLNKIEKKFYSKADWISHTNGYRMELFLKDIQLNIDKLKCKILPNYPPSNWYLKDKKSDNQEKIRFVYVGSISRVTMYFDEFVNWMINQDKKYSLDIYAARFTKEEKEWFDKFRDHNIILHDNVEYYKLPSILVNYDIGLILYRGHIPNYIYNAPNKLFEYLACGLDVWYPKEMIGCHQYKNLVTHPLVLEIDFKKIITINTTDEFTQKRIQDKNIYNCESVYEDLYKIL